MKKIITLGLSLLTLISSIWVSSIYVEETPIILKPWLNVVSTPGLLKWISFSNWGDHISFATLQNQIWKAVNITNDNIWTVISPLAWFIVRNDTSEDVTMTLSYDTNLDESQTYFEKNLDNWRNLLWITTASNPFNNITNAEVTSTLDFTENSNKIITWKSPKTATNFTLWKAYWVFIDSNVSWSWVYSWQNNNEKLGWFTEDECQEICENNEDKCPDECRIWILSENPLSNVTIPINSDSRVTVYNWTFVANKYFKINKFQINCSNKIPAWDNIKFYVFLDNAQKPEATLDHSHTKREYTRSEKKINTWDTVSVRIEAKYNWTTINTNYNFKFKFLWKNIEWNSVRSYETNFQTISIITAWDDEIPDDPQPQYSEDFIKAYNWANSKWILNNQIINYENLNDNINNTELIVFMNNYAKNILNRENNTTEDCSFIDTESLTQAQKDASIESCQLWLLEENDNINFNNQSDLSTFSTLLSRALWNDRYNWWDHLSALYTAWIVKNINNPENNQLKWDILVVLMNSEWKNEYRRVTNSYDFLMNDFNDVKDIYSWIKTYEWDRVIFIVRHSARENNCESEGWLTDYGIELARWVWEKLKWEPFSDTSTDFYGSSTVKRAVQTSYYVWESRGSEVLESVLNDDTRNDYSFVNHSSNIHQVVYWNYFKDAAKNSPNNINNLYENNRDIVSEKALYSVNKLCNITNWHPFSWITSHDYFTLPITEWATNESVSFSNSNSERPNFMQWIAIIVHSYWGWEVYPVKSLETGKIDKSLNPSC